KCVAKLTANMRSDEHQGSEVSKCGPPPEVDYADTIELKKDEYNTGERVEYSCFNKYTLDLRPPFSKYLTCEQGEWSGNIKCLKPCTVTVEEMNRRGIGLAYADRQKMFTPHNDYITFMCQRGKDLVRAMNCEEESCHIFIKSLWGGTE
uniref:Sushi domain-containing protein n=1 Tax=Cyprinus carpio TaxID=7962 RepID=A0A8C2E6V8_CYPCA